MMMVISPSKTLDCTATIPYSPFSMPRFLNEATELISICRKLSVAELQEKMKISPALAQLNYNRFHNWQPNFSPENAKQALFAYKGDVYEGLNSSDFTTADIQYAQQSLRILSGLYGIIKPLDLIQAYRLEMGTLLPGTPGKNLYQYWGQALTQYLNDEFAHREHASQTLINLASEEYFKVLTLNKLNVNTIKPVFMDEKHKQYKVISFYAKKARGMMLRFIIKNRLTDPNHIKKFNSAGYQFSPQDSTATRWFFKRSEASANRCLNL